MPTASNIVALIVAGGKGTRFDSIIPKQYTILGGVPILRHTILAFLNTPAINKVQVVIHPDDRERYKEAVAGLDLLPPVLGGATRQDSVRHGLEALIPYSPEKILIHDAARPFVSPILIQHVIASLADARAVIPTLPLFDTVKRSEGKKIVATLDRNQLCTAQTPQGFYFADIVTLHQRFQTIACTDDAALFEQAGIAVHAVDGDPTNIKITTEKDIVMRYETRIGSGFDAHRFREPSISNPFVMLCGVAVPHNATLEAHSDGDVALHALVDALLGTIGAGDIGLHFPPSDPQWRGADSKQFVEHACKLVREKNGRIVNADITLISEAPRIGPYREKMAASVAAILEIEPFRVNIKATTTEKMGFTGRKEGIASQAVVSVEFAVYTHLD